MTRPGTSRYLTLDGMRGLAAIMVALLHLQETAVPHGYLAVDFFFALSGFVLARAYEERLLAGMGIGRFLELRAVRLWPLFFVGIAIGSAYSAQQIIRSTIMHQSIFAFATSTTLNLMMIPSPIGSNLFSANPVFWSIFTEMVANIAFAVFLWRARTPMLWVLAVGFAAVIVPMVQASGHADGGATWETLPIGFVRTGLSFIIGMIVARHAGRWRRRPGAVSLLAIGALCAVLLMPFPSGSNGPFDLVAIMAAFPVLIILGAVFDPPPALKKLCAVLGDISYALYATHAPIAFASRNLAERLHLPAIALAAPFLLVTMALAAAATRFWDEPARRYISQRLALRRSAMPTIL